MHIFRRVILPSAFLFVLLLIAGLLAWIAFKPAPEDGFDSTSATGQPQGSSVFAERGSIANSLELKGSIAVDPPTAVKADHEARSTTSSSNPATMCSKGHSCSR